MIKFRSLQGFFVRLAAALMVLAGAGLGAVVPASPALADNGSILRTITAQSPSCGVGTGLAFDGNQLLLDCWGSGQIWGVSPVDGHLLNTYTIAGVSDLGAMAFDRGRNRLWVCSNRNEIDLVDLATQTASVAFTSQGCIDGLAYDGSDGTIWSSDDAAPTVQHYKIDGTLMSSSSVSSILGGCGNSGIAVGGSQLVLANNGCSQIYLASKSLASATLFGTYPARLEDLECDDLTFSGAGKAAIWSKDAYDNTVNAFELNPGTCGFGGVSPGPVQIATHDVVVANTDSTLASSQDSSDEPSIAVNPTNPNQIVVVAGSESLSDRWGSRTPKAPIWLSNDAGQTWSKSFSVPAPPRRHLTGCPCDTTVEYSRDGTLYLSVLSKADQYFFGLLSSGGNDVYTASNSGDPAKASDWHWRTRQLAAQTTNSTQYKTFADQPWIVTGPAPRHTSTDNVYVGYSFTGIGQPQARVATSVNGAAPADFIRESSPGSYRGITGRINPGLRIATDPRSGALYALWETATSGSSGDVPLVTYHLNASIDGGKTWRLNRSANGIKLTTTPSFQGSNSEFGNVDALLGGVDHLAVDPNTSDVYIAYGGDGVSGAGNKMYVMRLTAGAGAGTLVPGAPVAVTGSDPTALPSIAVRQDGTVGLLYAAVAQEVTIGRSVTTQFVEHFAMSKDHGVSWQDNVLSTFQLPSTVCSSKKCPRSRQLGDYAQVKAVGNAFFGIFAAARSAYAPGISGHDSTLDPVMFVSAR